MATVTVTGPAHSWHSGTCKRTTHIHDCHTGMHTYTHWHTGTRARARPPPPPTHTPEIHTPWHIRARARARTHTLIPHTHTHTYTNTYRCTHTSTQTHTHTQTDTHTNTHTWYWHTLYQRGLSVMDYELGLPTMPQAAALNLQSLDRVRKEAKSARNKRVAVHAYSQRSLMRDTGNQPEHTRWNNAVHAKSPCDANQTQSGTDQSVVTNFIAAENLPQPIPWSHGKEKTGWEVSWMGQAEESILYLCHMTESKQLKNRE